MKTTWEQVNVRFDRLMPDTVLVMRILGTLLLTLR